MPDDNKNHVDGIVITASYVIKMLNILKSSLLLIHFRRIKYQTI